ncbi:MAG: amino acid permease [Cyanobium sp. PLM2.Bin73]|nr:MAG: amino acid permease [Cyanobium sp. PLM2.Bin73]
MSPPGLQMASRSPDAFAANPPARMILWWEAVCMIVGLVIGAGIFRTPSLVAQFTQDPGWLITAWILGAGVSFSGALCYAELSSAHPHIGGDYHFLTLAYGRRLAFLYAWAKATVINPGSIALLAFLFSDSLSRVLPLGSRSQSLWALLVVALLTAFNLLGIHVAAALQKRLVVVLLAGLLIITWAGFASDIDLAAISSQAFQSRPPTGNLGTAMVFVLLTFGGWNEAASISADVKGGHRATAAVLLLSLTLITAIYLLFNLALLSALGINALAENSMAAVTVLANSLGPGAELAVVLLIGAATLSSINATMAMGARANQALAQDWEILKIGSGPQLQRHTRTANVLLQSLISSTMIVVAAVQPDGFKAIVEYTAPLFWTFLSLVALAVIILRHNTPHIRAPFRTPLFPLLPLLFGAACVYLTMSSVQYAVANQGGFISLLVLASGMLALAGLSGRQRQQNISAKQPGP